MGRIYRNLYLTAEQADELIEVGKSAYVVFEEPAYSNGPHKGRDKNYDLTKGIFESLEVAKDFVKSDTGEEPIYITNYADYISGNYDYL